jgi:AraC-like DNA-binding protein
LRHRQLTGPIAEMSRRQSGFTRASALGPIASVVEGLGGSIGRILQDVDLPLALLERRELVVPLREQFRLLERAARATGDEHFGARLGSRVKARELNAFGRWVCAAPTLAAAIDRSSAGIAAMLQTSTVLSLEVRRGCALWSIEFLDPECEGRYHNELLGAGYLIDLVRTYAGPRWTPDYVLTTAARGSPTGDVEQILRSNVSHGHAVTTIGFDAALLAVANPDTVLDGGHDLPAADEPALPAVHDSVGAITAVLELALQEGAPRLEWVSAKLGTTPRTLQRKLAQAGTAYHAVLEDLLRERSAYLVAHTRTPITDIALELGYSDPAHFTRAFRRWTGTSPLAFRKGVSQP